MNPPHRQNDATSRFSDRVDDYAAYRPGYPADVIPCLVEETGLDPAWKIADVGSGTGILSRLFLENGNTVYGVEPNAEMRSAGESQLAGYQNFIGVAGRAEATSLESATVDLVAAGQAFHWFDAAAARCEFGRVLRPPCWVALVWYTRLVDATPLMRDYESLLLERAIDYTAVDHRNVGGDVLASFFETFSRKAFPHKEFLDLPHLQGRLRSASYVPAAGHPDHTAFFEALRGLFDRHQQDGRVAIDYETELYIGRLRAIDDE